MGYLAPISLVLLLASCGVNESAENAMAVDDTLTADNATDVAEDGTPRIRCAAIENMLATEEECEDLAALQEDVKPGPAAFDAPGAMVRGKPYEVTLVIDRKSPAPPPPPPPPPEPAPGDNTIDAAENVAGGEANVTEPEPAAGSRDDHGPTANEVVAELPGADTPFVAQVGRYMTATLTGSGFTIKLIDPSDPMQVIPRGGQARWQWEVVPTIDGKRRLTVKTQAVGIVDGKRVPLGNGDSSLDVDVTVTKWDRFWDWVKEAPGRIDLLTAVLVALGGLVAAWIVLRKRWKGKS